MNSRYLLVMFALCAASAWAIAGKPINPDMLNATERVRLVGPNTKGAAVLRVQVLLDRAHFSSGEIDAAYGKNLRTAINGFQKANGLKVTGKVDAPTWDILNADTAPILTAYTVLDADANGPYEPIPTELADKAKMTKLGYTSVAEALGEKFHVKPTLLTQLNPGKDFAHAGEEIMVPNVAAPGELPKAAKVIISQSDSTLTLVNASGKTIAQFPASIGSKHDPLPLGTWKVKSISINPTFHFNPKLFWDAEPDATKVKIPAGPNNPVGVVWIDLSKAHYGIHGTPEPASIGKTQSHGCIRLTNWDATMVAQSVAAGIHVLLQK